MQRRDTAAVRGEGGGHVGCGFRQGKKGGGVCVIE